MVKAKRCVSKIYQSLGAVAMANRPRSVMPKHLVPPEESKDKEEPAQDSSVDCEEDDDTGNAGGSRGSYK